MNFNCQCCLSQFFKSTAWPHWISGLVLSSHSIVSSSRTVRPYSSWEGWWIGHSEWKHLTPVRRRLSRTHAVLGRVITGGRVPVSGMEVWSLVRLSNHSAFHRWSAQGAALLMLLSDQLMSCCAAGTNGCLDLSRHAFPLSGQESAEWCRCPGSMARRARDSVAPLRQSSAGWMPARTGKLCAGAGRRQVWALRYQTGAQYSAVEWPVLKGLFATLLLQHPSPSHWVASRVRRVMSTFCEVTQGVGDTWATCLTWLRGIWARSRKAEFCCCCCGWLSAHV